MQLPYDIIHLIMHFYGAYTLNPDERPYIKEIKLIKQYLHLGVKQSLQQLKIYYKKKMNEQLYEMGLRYMYWGDTYQLLYM